MITKVYPEFANIDRKYSEEENFPVWDGFEVVVGGERVMGYTMAAGGPKDVLHPAVVLLHGFPGHTQNTDISAALMRSGITTINPHYRGCWGSDGNYSFTGNIEDATAIAKKVRSKEFCEQYQIDPDNIFFVGHSIGGFTTINTMRRVPWIRGGVCIAPYDMAYYWEKGDLKPFEWLLTTSDHLHVSSPTSLYENARDNLQDVLFAASRAGLVNRNLYFIGGAKDPLAPPKEMIEPLYNYLKDHHTEGDLKYDLLDTDHDFMDYRIEIASKIAHWIAKIVG